MEHESAEGRWSINGAEDLLFWPGVLPLTVARVFAGSDVGRNSLSGGHWTLSGPEAGSPAPLTGGTELGNHRSSTTHPAADLQRCLDEILQAASFLFLVNRGCPLYLARVWHEGATQVG